MNRKKTTQRIADILNINVLEAESLEHGVYNKSVENSAMQNEDIAVIYECEIYRLLANLDIDSYVNNGIRNPVLDVTSEYENLAKKNNANLNPNSETGNIIELIKQRATQEVEQKFTTEYMCGKCKTRKAKEYKIQTRSADEGYTYKAECIKCEHVWNLN